MPLLIDTHSQRIFLPTFRNLKKVNEGRYFPQIMNISVFTKCKSVPFSTNQNTFSIICVRSSEVNYASWVTFLLASCFSDNICWNTLSLSLLIFRNFLIRIVLILKERKKNIDRELPVESLIWGYTDFVLFRCIPVPFANDRQGATPSPSTHTQKLTWAVIRRVIWTSQGEAPDSHMLTKGHDTNKRHERDTWIYMGKWVL